MVDVVTAHSFITTVGNSVTTRVAASWMWYVIRAAGFVAAGLLIALMISGIGQVTGLTYKFIEPLKAWALHKALAFALCGAIFIHILFLFLDHYIPFSVFGILIPFVSHYSNHTTLFGVGLSGIAVALGILAMYSVIIVVLSSLGWINTKKGLWRKLHYLNYFTIVAIFIHALGVGSDLKYGLFRTAWIFVGLLLTFAVVYRLWFAGTLRGRKDSRRMEVDS